MRARVTGFTKGEAWEKLSIANGWSSKGKFKTWRYACVIDADGPTTAARDCEADQALYKSQLMIPRMDSDLSRATLMARNSNQAEGVLGGCPTLLSQADRKAQRRSCDEAHSQQQRSKQRPSLSRSQPPFTSLSTISLSLAHIYSRGPTKLILAGPAIDTVRAYANHCASHPAKAQ